MRITVGHLLIVGGLGTYLVLGPLGGWEKLNRPEKDPVGVDAPVTTRDVPPPTVPIVPVVEEKLPAAESVPAETVTAPPVVPDEPVAGPAPVVPAEKPKAVIPVAKAKPTPHPVRKKRAKASKPAAKPAAKAAAADDDADLIGVYVTLKLVNGREIKGALVEKSASFYKIELPGLGAMSYPARDVVSITPSR